ncbi:hypothetical protein BH09BAC1_BH09BAC1_20160 [soil metagenome]
MRTIVLMLCLAMLGGTMNTAFAQEKTKQKPTAEEMATKRTAKLTEVLKLDANQQKQVYSIVLDHGKRNEEVRNAKLTEDERRSQKKELFASFEAQIKTVLNAEQYKTYLAKKEEMKGKKGGQHHNGVHPKVDKK